jgi:hypothetical protein
MNMETIQGAGGVGHYTNPQTRPAKNIICGPCGPAAKLWWPNICDLLKPADKIRNPQRTRKISHLCSSRNLAAATAAACRRPHPSPLPSLVALRIWLPLSSSVAIRKQSPLPSSVTVRKRPPLPSSVDVQTWTLLPQCRPNPCFVLFCCKGTAVVTRTRSPSAPLTTR